MKALLAFIAGAGLALVPTATAALTPTPNLTQKQQTRLILRQDAQLCRLAFQLRLGGAHVSLPHRCIPNRANTP